MNIKKGFTLTKAKCTEGGFTLIELLVVISIIGILAALATVSFTGTQKQARDTQRKSDIKMYQTALETFANNNGGLYPECANGAVGVKSQLCQLITGNDPSICPDDPKYDGINPNFIPYKYQTDGSLCSLAVSATKYAMWTKLENTQNYWVICSSGTVFTSTTTPDITDCP